MTELGILLATFASVMIVSVIVLTFVSSRREIATRVDRQTQLPDELEIAEDIRGLAVSEAELVRNYFQVTRSDNNPNSVANRLIRAGYFSPTASRNYQIIRVAISLVVFTIVILGVSRAFPELPRLTQIIIGLFATALTFFICNIMLERIGDRREVMYRKLFPDFMDTLIVCVDAGLSVEAAVDRVSKEFLKSSTKDFGLHLAIMMLEVRGGRRLKDALSNFAARLRIEEAKSLAVLFRQSEELGASVTKTLRIFSAEMRDKRMIRAEEKANSLPIKMLFPLAAFLFPISVLIVAVPILMRVIAVLISLSSPAV